MIATFVTVVEMVMHAFFPDLYDTLGVFISLIVVNCIIFARAESFAFKNPPLASMLDGLGMGLGFTLAITLLSCVRELLGAGTIFGIAMHAGNLPAHDHRRATSGRLHFARPVACGGNGPYGNRSQKREAAPSESTF